MQLNLRLALTLAALFAPGLAMAEDSILVRPADCKAVMTIQKHGCEVETQLRCGTGAAEYWRSELTESDGLSSVSIADMGYNMTRYESSDSRFGVFIDPAQSFSDLPQDIISKGHGVVVQIGMMSVMGIRKPISLRAEVTSETAELTISEHKLHRFDAVYLAQLPPPMPLIHGTGKIYHDAVTGVLFDGEQVMDWPKKENKIATSPAAIILPGEPGFDQPHPAYDCGEISMNPTDEKADRS